MRFDVYGRFTLEVKREADQWRVFRLVPGKKVLEPGIVLPSFLDETDIADTIDDLFHERSKPGECVRRVD